MKKISSFTFLLLLAMFGSILLWACGEVASTPPINVSPSAAEALPVNSEAKQLRHVVLFKFKESATSADIQAVEAAFKKLPEQIAEIKDFEWGTNNSPEGLDKGFTHCFFVTFDSEAGREVYLPHPKHLAFVEVLKPHLDDVLVVDYWAEK